MREEKVEGLALNLHGHNIGVLAHYAGGKNILSFNPDYIGLANQDRPTFTLTQLLDPEFFSESQVRATRLPPILSNLLPEGALREYLTDNLKVHIDDEFSLMLHLRSHLPGALKVEPILEGGIPEWALTSRERVEPIQVDVGTASNKFSSLAGVQMKFSGERGTDGRYNIGGNGVKEDWIIKTPSTKHRHVPYNEYTAMKLAASLGVEIPEMELVDKNKFEGLPDIQLPNESDVYTIKRFDRSDEGNIHTEDFAQIFGLYARDKYKKFNYDHIAVALLETVPSVMHMTRQMTLRLLANLLVGNGDAHLKNWSVIYRDGRTPELSPAYDIVSTIVYLENDKGVALNMQKRKEWAEIGKGIFDRWAEENGLSKRLVRKSVNDAIKYAQSEWPTLLDTLPMIEDQKIKLKKHWQSLHPDFRF